MIDRLENMPAILDRGISGYHEYIFADDGRGARLAHVSVSLCKMLGCSEEELSDSSRDRYFDAVHPADKERYAEFISELSRGETTLSAQYRLIRKDKSVICVADTMTTLKNSDGELVGCSTLCDITAIKSELGNLKFLDDTVPCGFLKFTCDAQPKITYINKRMLELLRFPHAQDGESDYLNLYKDNIFLMIPMEERRKFSAFLNRVFTMGTPISGEINVLRFDGTKAYMFGWVTKTKDEHGNDEFQSICTDITEQHIKNKEQKTQRYLKALSHVYDCIFEFDFSDNTVKCIYINDSVPYKWVKDIPMRMEEATQRWISETVCESDRPVLQNFFKDLYRTRYSDADSNPPTIEYHALSGGSSRKYSGIFLKIDSSVCLFCSKSVSEDSIMPKNDTQTSVRIADGIVAFEIDGDMVRPIYTSDSICNFFKYSKDEWQALATKMHPIRDFISRSDITYESVQRLFKDLSADFSFKDGDKIRHIRAVCSRKTAEGGSEFYVILYNMDSEYKKADAGASGILQKPKIKIRTFGYFDTFVDGRPIAFRSQKSKELFALLVDRRGGYVSSEEAISFLWEDEPVNPVTLARYRKVALRLKNILEEYGISDAVESVDGKRRIVTERVECDLYDYLSGKEGYASLFKGSYLTNYSWGENTLAELSGNIFH